MNSNIHAPTLRTEGMLPLEDSAHITLVKVSRAAACIAHLQSPLNVVSTAVGLERRDRHGAPERHQFRGGADLCVCLSLQILL